MQLVHAEENGDELYKAALASGFEGVIAKRKDSSYEAGKRSQAWLKIKPTKSAEFVIGGITKGKGSRAQLGALLLGYWNEGKLHYCGHVGSGFDERTLAQVKARCEKLASGTRPFIEEPDLHSPTTWITPELVAEVEFQQWTPDGMLRAPVFLRLRDDVDPKSVRRTEPRAASGAISRPVAEAGRKANPATTSPSASRPIRTDQTGLPRTKSRVPSMGSMIQRRPLRESLRTDHGYASDPVSQRKRVILILQQDGIVAQGSFDQLVEGFALIHADQARRSLFARNIRAYVREHHALTEKIHQLDQLLAQWKSNG